VASLNLQRLASIAKYECGAELGTPQELRELAGQAGRHLFAARQWQFLEGRQVRLRPRAAITVTGATWTNGTLTLTKAGAFADYVPLSADTLEVTEGTGATLGTYEVVSRPTANTIVLRTSIGAAADAQTDIVATLPNDQIALPLDFSLQQITAYAIRDGLVGAVDFTTPQGMLSLRAWGTIGSVVGFWALLRYVRGYAGGRPVPRLELHPRAGDANEALVIYYRGGWKDPDTDAEELGIPAELDGLYIEVFKCHVMGNEEPEKGSVDQRLSQLRGGVLWSDAVRWDAGVQTDFGYSQGCWMDGPFGPTSRFDVPPPLVLP
jgi:hypothetical protein